MSWLDKIVSAFSVKAAPAPQPAPVPPPVPTRAAPSAPVTKPGQFLFNNSAIVALDEQVKADIRIELAGCKQLKSLPAGLKTGTLDLTGCTALEHLPTGLDVAFLDLADCAALEALPDDLKLRGGRLNLRNCAKVSRLPANMGSVAQLDLSGCKNITDLPSGLTITSWIDIGRSGISTLPASLSHLSVRRDGKAVAADEAFAA